VELLSHRIASNQQISQVTSAVAMAGDNGSGVRVATMLPEELIALPKHFLSIMQAHPLKDMSKLSFAEVAVLVDRFRRTERCKQRIQTILRYPHILLHKK